VPSTAALVLFVPAALVLLVIPGPSVLYIVTRSIDQGRRAGLVSVLGTHTGSLVHVAGAAFGVSALIVSSALAFSAVKYLGAAYLLWLGIRRWRAGDRVLPTAERPPVPTAHLFRQGFVVQVLNPRRPSSSWPSCPSSSTPTAARCHSRCCWAWCSSGSGC
jgi:threonine/homoserine/homoserine lactone efflux protein